MKIKYLTLVILSFGLLSCGQSNESDLLIVCDSSISEDHINFDFKNQTVTEKSFYKPWYLKILKESSPAGTWESELTVDYPIDEYTDSYIRYSSETSFSKLTKTFNRATLSLAEEFAHYNLDGSLREPFGDMDQNPIYTKKNCKKPVV